MSSEILREAFSTNDGLAKLAQMFSELAGRELSPDALACVSFFQANGSPDLAADILRDKRFQVKARDIIKMVEALSPATAHKEMISAQAEATKSIRGI